MKGVSYLVNEQGEKTHAVLDLKVWQATLETLLLDATRAQVARQERKPGFLTEVLIRAGYTRERLDEMNRRSAEEALSPLSAEELGLSSSL